MPTVLVPEEDRFTDVAEMLSLWQSLLRYVSDLPVSISPFAAAMCRDFVDQLSLDDLMLSNDWDPLPSVYSPSVANPFWSPTVCERLRIAPRQWIEEISARILHIGHATNTVVARCASIVTAVEAASDGPAAFISGIIPRESADITSPCLMPDNLLPHKLITMALFIMRAMPPAWLQSQFGPLAQVDSALYGLLPWHALESTDSKQRVQRLGYVHHADPGGGLRFVPLTGEAASSSKFCLLRQHIGRKELAMIVREGEGVVLDRGLYLTLESSGCIYMSAVSGWTGQLETSFTAAPVKTVHASIAVLQQFAMEAPSAASIVRAELEARQRPDYFHIILAIKSLVPKEEWPTQPRELLFIATPQLGIESDLVVPARGSRGAGGCRRQARSAADHSSSLSAPLRSLR